MNRFRYTDIIKLTRLVARQIDRQIIPARPFPRIFNLAIKQSVCALLHERAIKLFHCNRPAVGEVSMNIRARSGKTKVGGSLEIIGDWGRSVISCVYLGGHVTSEALCLSWRKCHGPARGSRPSPGPTLACERHSLVAMSCQEAGESLQRA